MPALWVKAQYPLYSEWTAIKESVAIKQLVQPILTHVMGFMNGTLTSTASATKFSTSRSMGSLYLDLTYSGLAAYRHATRPPSGVIPTRSPMPNTASDLISVSVCNSDVNLRNTYRYQYGWRLPQARCRRSRWPSRYRCASGFQCHNQLHP